MEIPKSLSDAKAALERVALRLRDDASDVQEALALVNRARAERAAIGRPLAPVAAPPATPYRPQGGMVQQQPYQPPAALRDRAGKA
jgi:hypothetical protein